MSWDFIFPTREGGVAGSSIENRMLNKVGGANTIRTEIRTMADGSTVMLRTRNGFPEFTRTPAAKAVEKALDEYVLFGRMFANTYPWGVAKTAGGVQTTAYSTPTHPISKTTLTAESMSASFTEDEALTDSIGSSRWMDTRPVPQSTKVLTWEPMTGNFMSAPEPSYLALPAYFAVFSGDAPMFTSATPENNVITYRAGRRFFGQRDFTGGAHRIVPAFASSRTLFIDGVASSISGKLVSACIFFSGETELVRLITVDGFYTGTSFPWCNQLYIKTLTLSGGVSGIPNVTVTIPESYVGIVSIAHPPVFNSSGTQAVMACTMLLPGYDLPASVAYHRPAVLVIDCATGVATEVPVAGQYGSETSSPYGVRQPVDRSAEVNEYAYETTTKHNIVVAVGYIGDDLRFIRHEHASAGGYLERFDRAKHATINVWANQTYQQVATLTKSSKLIVEPAGTVVYETANSYNRVDRTDYVATYVADEENPALGTLVNLEMTNSIFAEGSEDGGDIVSGVFADFSTGTLGVLRIATKYETPSNGAYVYTYTSAAPYKVTRSREAYVRKTIYTAALDIVDMSTAAKKTIFKKQNTAFSETSFAAVGPDQTVSVPIAYGTSPAWAIETLPSFSSSFLDGANRTVPFPLSGGVDGVSFSVSPDGKVAFFSMSLGNAFNMGNGLLANLDGVNILAVKKDGVWEGTQLAIPSPACAAPWFMETAIFKKDDME